MRDRRFYAIVDLEACASANVGPLEHAGRCIAHGAGWLQLRAKLGSDDDHRAVARAIAELCERASVNFVVNDRVELAAAVGAPFVHVGQGDASAEAVAASAPFLRVGRSTHDPRELERSLIERPAYVAFGPIFPTKSKRTPAPVVGLEGLAHAHAAARAAGVELVAIGGLASTDLGAVLARCDAAAFISALLPENGEDPSRPLERVRLALEAASRVADR